MGMEQWAQVELALGAGSPVVVLGNGPGNGPGNALEWPTAGELGNAIENALEDGLLGGLLGGLRGWPEVRCVDDPENRSAIEQWQWAVQWRPASEARSPCGSRVRDCRG